MTKPRKTSLARSGRHRGPQTGPALHGLGWMRRPRSEQRGVALITTLLLLMLLSGLALAMAWSARSDMLINGYYRSFRGSFYAADSGLNIARQDVSNQIMAGIQTNWNATTPPFANPTTTASNVVTYLTNTYGTYQKLNTGGVGANSWPADYKITPSKSGNPLVSYVGCTIQDGSPCTAPTSTITQYNYIFSYDLTAIGQSRGGEAATVADNGTLTIVAPLTGGTSNKSFAAWGMFIDQWNICSGGYLVPGTISGPVFTNGAWTFGPPTAGTYTFTDPVGSVGADFGYQFSSVCDQSTNPSYKQGNTVIAPTFKAGYNLGQSPIVLPPNDYNQERAVLDGKGVSNGQPVSKQDLNNTVRDVAGNPYPMSGANGVYLPYTTTDSNGNTIPPTFTGGGILVQGDASVTLQPLGTSAQVYTIKQGSTTTTITIDPVTNTTIMASGGSAVTIQGVPAQYDPASGNRLGYDTMLYVNGNITSLSGPGEGMGAIQDGTALTITASSNVTITGDVRYKTEPVTTTSSGSTPMGTVVANNGQALGIFTASGNIYMNDTQVNSSGTFDGLLEIDASLATISAGGSGALINNAAQIDTLTIVGGRIQNQIQGINTKTRNVVFDRRYGGGFAPPWFPSTTVSLGTPTPGTPSATFFRLQWLNQTPYD